MNNGFVRIPRSITSESWYKDANTLRLYLWLMMNAKYKDEEWKSGGIVIHRGEVVTSYKKMAESIGISVQSVRTALDKLEATQRVTRSGHPKYTVISIKDALIDYASNKVSNNSIKKGISKESVGVGLNPPNGERGNEVTDAEGHTFPAQYKTWRQYLSEGM